MKKNAVAILLSIIMALGSISSTPAFAVEKSAASNTVEESGDAGEALAVSENKAEYLTEQASQVHEEESDQEIAELQTEEAAEETEETQDGEYAENSDSPDDAMTENEQEEIATELGQEETVTETNQEEPTAGEAQATAEESAQEQKDSAQTSVAQELPEEEVIIEYNGVPILTSRPAMQSIEPLSKSSKTCSTLSEALDYVREKMIARQETIAITVPEKVVDQLDLDDYTDLFAHTGDPRGGDYLRSAITYLWASWSTEGDGSYEVEYNFGYKTNASEEAEADAEVDRLISALDLNSGSKSDYDKVKAIHDYIVENVEYDYDTYYGYTYDYPGTYTGYGALVNHLAVCQGFASMFYRLCLEADIDARLIDSNELGHAWNIVQLDGLYYLMDCTWDENTESEDYFLRGKFDFTEHSNSDDQFQDSAFAARYPLSDYKYGWEIHSFGTAPEYTLITQDRRTVSTVAENGRAKVLIFFLQDCGRFLYTMETLRGKEYDGVDFVYCNMYRYSTEELQDILAEIGNVMPEDVPGTYALCSNGNNARAAFEDIAGLDDGSGYIYSASVFLIDPDNQILFAENAYAGEIGNLVEAMLEDADLPEAPEQGEDPYEGFTAIGLCGQNAVWRFYGDDGGAYGKGTLLINGKGKLWNNGYGYTQIGWLAADQQEEDSFSAENIQASQVQKVIIGDSITHIGTGDFKDFTSVQSITFKGPVPTISSSHGLTRNIRIYYPDYEPSWEKVNKGLFSSGCRWISQDENGVHHHKWGGSTVTKEPTCTEEGMRESVCTECGETASEAIPATGHKWATEYTVDKKPTKTEEGSESIHCTVCDVIKEGSARTIPVITQETQELMIDQASVVVVMGRTVNVTVAGAQGALTCEAEDRSMATATVTGSKITVTGLKTGTVKMIVTATETADYESAETEFELMIVPGKTTRGDMFNLANNVKVTWTEVPGAKYYKVYREGVTDPSESLTDPVIVTSGLIGWDKEPGLTNGHAYRYKIVASLTGRDDDGNLDPSGDSPLSYSKLMYRLKTVVIRSVKNTAPGKVTVKYDKTTSGDSYVLQYCEREDMVGASTKVVLGANNTSYVIGGLKKGKTYYISIRVRKKVNGIDYYTTFGVAKKIKITQ